MTEQLEADDAQQLASVVEHHRRGLDTRRTEVRALARGAVAERADQAAAESRKGGD
jgi:hypothetical protein